MLMNVLNNAAIETRSAACRACPHAIAAEGVWSDRKMWCGVRFNGDWADRRQPAYLPRVVASPEACPIGSFHEAGEGDVRKASDAPYVPQSVFHVLWAEIHDPTRRWTAEWVASVRKRLPCGECRREFKAYVEANPIPFGDDQACWDYGVRLHDQVNARLGKPLFGLEAARAKHGPARSSYAKAIDDVRRAEEEETTAAREERRRRERPTRRKVIEITRVYEELEKEGEASQSSPGL